MDPEKQKKIASLGGKASHASGNGHQWDSEEARRAALRAVEKRERAKREQLKAPEECACVEEQTCEKCAGTAVDESKGTR